MKNFDLTRAADDHFVGGRISPYRTEAVTNDGLNGAQRIIDVWVNTGALKTVSSSGRVVSRAPASKALRYRVWMSWHGGAGKVVAWKKVVVK